MTITWPFTPPTTAEPGVVEAGEGAALDSSVDLGIPFYYRAADFLALVDRVLPDWYVEPLKNAANSGYELLQAYAALFERTSLAVGRFQTSSLVMFSSGGQRATASVEFYRQNLGTGSFVISAGSIVSTSKTGRQYVLPADISFGPTDYVKPTIVVSAGFGPEYNVAGPVVTADGTLLPGEIDTIVLPFMVPVFAEPSIKVRQVVDAVGGTAPVLDQLGQDRGISKLSGETDISYKRRIMLLPDTVSPAGIRRQLDAAFFSQRLPYKLFETWQHSYQSCWDAPLGDTSNPIQGVMLEGTFAWTDPRTDRVSGLWMGEEDHRGAYVLVLPRFPCLEDRSMAWDDTASTFRDLRTNYGVRADSAWDSQIQDGPLYVSGCWDGVDTSQETFIGSIWDLFKRIKGGGVQVSFVLPGITQVELQPSIVFPPL
jgi:hypothetical protein